MKKGSSIATGSANIVYKVITFPVIKNSSMDASHYIYYQPKGSVDGIT